MKPYRGEIHNWSILKHSQDIYSIFGRPVGHPVLVYWIRTSPVVKKEGNMIETENSQYLLVGEERPLPEFLRRNE